MPQLLIDLKYKVSSIDKFLFVIICCIPFALTVSIFVADLFGSIAGITLIYLHFKTKIILFQSIKKEIIFMVIFYLIILISLVNSEYAEVSFLPSFFYFRYFLVSLTIFYLLKKYDFAIKLFYYSLLFTLLFICLDGFIQYFTGANLAGYDYPGRFVENSIRYSTSFFDQEKKLGSYLVRLLPLLLAIIYFQKKNEFFKLDLFCLVILGAVILITSERTALLLYFLVCISYLLVIKNRLLMLISIVPVFMFFLISNEILRDKYTVFTLSQMEIINLYSDETKQDIKNVGSLAYIKKDGYSKLYRPRYYSIEHENFIYTAFQIFKKNIFFGSGVKTFFYECNHLKEKQIKTSSDRRGHQLKCSTHPHSIFPQILSDIGIFGFLFVLIFFSYISITFLRLIFKFKRLVKEQLAYYFANIGLLISLFPLVPSGSIFNNWICITIFYLFGFWLFFREKLNIKNNN